MEIGEAVAAKLGVKPEFVEGKWDGLIAGLDSKRYDAVINQVGITEERQKKFNFSNPYIVSKVVLIVNDKDDTIKDFADLKGKKSAQSLTSNYGKLAKEAGAELVATDGFDQSIQLVLTGRADATLNDSLSFLDFKKHQPKAPVKVVAEKENADASASSSARATMISLRRSTRLSTKLKPTAPTTKFHRSISVRTFPSKRFSWFTRRSRKPLPASFYCDCEKLFPRHECQTV